MTKLTISRNYGLEPLEEDTKRAQICVLLHPLWFPPIPNKSFGMYGGDDGARTRDLCRDRAAL